MKYLISLFLACLMLISTGCSDLFPDYGMSPTSGDNFYEFGKYEIGIYFTYTRDAVSGIMTAENQTQIKTSIRVQRKYENGDWGRGVSFTLGKQGKYSFSEYYPVGAELRITIKRDGSEWSLRVDLE